MNLSISKARLKESIDSEKSIEIAQLNSDKNEQYKGMVGVYIDVTICEP